MQIFLAVIFLLVFIGMHIYMPYRLNGLLVIRNSWILYVVFFVGAISFILSSILRRAVAGELAHLYYTMLSSWMGFSIYLLLLLLIFECIRPVVHSSSKSIGIAIISLAVIMTTYSVWNASTFKVKDVSIALPKLNQKLSIVMIPDLHIGGFQDRAYLEDVVKTTNSLKPDIVLIPGDLVETKEALTDGSLTPLKELNAPAFFTTGNHETYAGLDKSLEVIAANNIRILRNEAVNINGVQLIGLDYMNADESSFDMHQVNTITIKEELPKIKISPNVPSILVHHSPVGLKYVAEAGVDLMLSGHVHGGQFFPGTLINKLFFNYVEGMYDVGNTQLYVSPGAGTFAFKMRLGTSNEITHIHLHPVTTQ